MNLPRYGFGPNKLFVDALLPEASSRDGESIEQILRSKPPAAFELLCHGGRPPKPAAKRRPPPQATSARRNPKNYHAMLVNGRVFETTADGKTTVDGHRVPESEFRVLIFGKKRGR